ncbi:MAG: hypothetical protein AAGF97_15800 [Planctomycetota bacterium]
MIATWMIFAQVAEPEGLTTAGAAVMVCSIGAVLSLVSFCLYRVMTLPPVDRDDED